MTSHETNNPFTYMWAGAKKMFKTNIVPYVLTTIALFVVIFIAMGAVVALFFRNADTLNFGEFITRALLSFAVIGVITLLILAFVSLILERLMLNGVRNKKTSIGQAVTVAKDRYLIMLKILAGFVGVTFVVGAVLGLLSGLLPVFAIVLSIAAVVAAIVLLILYLPMLAVLTLTLVDDKKPLGVKDVFQKSELAAAPIKGKIWLLVLVFVGASLLIGAVTGGYSTTKTTTYTTNGTTSLSTKTIDTQTPAQTGASNVLNGVLSFFLSCGVTQLYVLSRNNKSADTSHTAAKSKA